MSAAGRAGRPAATAVGRAARSSAADRRPPPTRSACDPGSRSSAGRSTRSRAISARASSSPATPTIRAGRPAASGSTGTARSRSRARSSRRRRWPAGYSVGAAMADDRPGARLVSRRDPRRHDHDRGAAGRGGRDATRRRRPRLPAVSRRRALADLGPGGTRRARRAHPRPRSRPHRPGDRRGLGTRHPPRVVADARGGRARHRDARLRRPGPEPRSGTRSRRT